MNIIERKHKKDILTLCKNSDTVELEKFLKENNVSLKDWNQELKKQEKKDLLLYAIENDVSYVMVQFILKHVQYETLNYTFIENKNGLSSHYETLFGTFGGSQDEKTPLFLAILKNNFRVADLLIQYQANINYFTRVENIVDFLCNCSRLNLQNLHYILSRGVRAEYFFLHIPSFLSEGKNRFLEILFKHYIYDNVFILSFINLSKAQTPQTTRALEDRLRQEKNKIYIHHLTYKNAIDNENYQGIMMLLDYDGRDTESLLEIIHDYQILERATKKQADSLVRKILSFKTIYH